MQRIVGSGNPATFITRAAQALDPDKQYYILKEQWWQHLEDSVYLLNVMNVMLNTPDNAMAKQISEAYFSSLRHPITEANVQLVIDNGSKMITGSKDIIFRLILYSARQVNTL